MNVLVRCFHGICEVVLVFILAFSILLTEKSVFAGESASQQWKHESQKLIARLRKIAVKVDKTKDLSPSAMKLLRDLDDSKEPLRKNDLSKHFLSGNILDVDHCLWDLWLATGEAPPLMKSEESLEKYIERCLERYESFITANKDSTDEQIVLKGLHNCDLLMNTPLWYSAYRYFLEKTPHVGPPLINHRMPHYRIFASTLPEDSHKELSLCYMQLLLKARSCLIWNKIEIRYDLELFNLSGNNTDYKKLKAATSQYDEYEVACERFIKLFHKLPSPGGTFFCTLTPRTKGKIEEKAIDEGARIHP